MSKKVLDAQTNMCYFSKLLAECYRGFNVIRRIANCGVNIEFLEPTRNIWCRDYMPIQISERNFVSYEYAPDYLEYLNSFQTNPARILCRMGIDTKPSGIILDGGNVIKTSKGIIMVDKVFEENRHIRKAELIKRLEKCFESEIIFLPWDREEKYGHADGIVREISDGRVLLTNYHHYDKVFAEKYTKILSKHFAVEVLDYKVKNPCKYNWCYINYLQIGNKIFIPQLTWEDYSPPYEAKDFQENLDSKTKQTKQFKWYNTTIEEDGQALEQYRRLLPDFEIFPVSCPHIVENGGALNCISWNIKQ